MQLNAHLGLAFATAPDLLILNLTLHTSNSSVHYAKGTQSPLTGLLQLVGIWFQGLLTPLTGVLFTFPSRYWFTIGHQRVFSLRRWSSQIHTDFQVDCATWVLTEHLLDFVYGTITLYGFTSQRIRLSKRTFPQPTSESAMSVPLPPLHNALTLTCNRFRLFPLRSPLLGESFLLSFPVVTKMFQFATLSLKSVRA